MILRRRLTFQLMPLLDLLLIVFFAQYLEVSLLVREESGRSEAAQRSLTEEKRLLSDDLERALEQLLALKDKLADLEELKTERTALSQEVRQAQAQRDLIGEMVVELFRLPESAVETVVQHKSGVGPGPTASEIRQLKQQLKNLSEDRGQEVVEHLLTFHELRKRCDLWELYVQDDGQIVFTVGMQRQILRAEQTDAFSSRLFDAYKALPQPKSLVLVLVSYGDARLGVRQAVLDGLPLALERIRADDEGRSRFDFAVLGYRPEIPQGDAP